jgi:predicted aspartyl protease
MAHKPKLIAALALTLGIALPLLAAASPHSGSPIVEPAASKAVPAPDDALSTTALIQPFDIDASRRMTVPVMIGGAGPFGFIVDTGAERTVISRELARRLTLTEGQPLRLATIGGTMTAPSYRVAALAMTNLTLGPIEAPALYGSHIGAAGLLGVDMLQGRRVLVDLRKEQMTVSHSRPRARPLIRDEDAIVVTARRLGGRLILSDARIDGKRVDLIVDTGAQTSVGNMALMRLVRDRRQHRFDFTPTTLIGVDGDPIAAEKTVVRRVLIEGMDINDLTIAFADSSAFRALGLQDRPALLLGMDGLRLFERVELDYANRRIIFDLPDAAGRNVGPRLAAERRVPAG